jgi:hypothetical protein
MAVPSQIGQDQKPYLLNVRSDEQVEIGYSTVTEDPEAFPGPQKFAFLSIRARSQVRTSARESIFHGEKSP